MTMRSRVAVLVLSIVVGVAGAVLVLVWADRNADNEVAEALEALDIREVLVATATVEAGTTLDEARSQGLVAFEDVAGPPDDALDRIVRTDLTLVFADRTYPGDVVTESRVAGEATPPAFPAQGEGRGAVTVTVGEAARGTTFLTSGATVAVLVTGLPPEEGAPGTRTCVLLPQLSVLAVGSRTVSPPGADEQAAAGGVPDQLVTVDVDPESALRLVQGDADGDLYFVRLRPDDSPFEPGDCEASTDLFG